MNKAIGIVVALLVIVGGGYAFTKGDKKDKSEKAGSYVEETVVQPEVEQEVELEQEPEIELNIELDPEVPQKVTLSVTPEEEEEVVTEPAPTVSEPIAVGNTRTAGSADAQPGVFTRYSESKRDDATGDIVLTFTADWCPSCRALEADLETNAGAIPSNLTILDVDFDSATDLKKKYGVTSQHTLVQIDAQGNEIQSWRGGNTLDSIVAKVN